MRTGSRRQLSLLDRAPAFRALFLATTVSGIGTWVAVIALTVDVYDRTHSAEWVSALLIADFLPAVVIGLAFGPVVDRFSRRRLMIGSDVVSVGVFAALIFAGTPGQIVALAAVAGFATGFFRPATYAGLPSLVEEADLPAANSLLRSTTHLTTVVGTLIGGAVVAAASPDLCYAVNAVSFAGSALLLATIPSGRMRAPRAPIRRGLSRRGTGGVLARLPLAGAARRVHLVEPRHARERRRERVGDLPRQGLVRLGQLRLRRSCGREPASVRCAVPCMRVRGSSGAACRSSTAPAWR